MRVPPPRPAAAAGAGAKSPPSKMVAVLRFTGHQAVAGRKGASVWLQPPPPPPPPPHLKPTLTTVLGKTVGMESARTVSIRTRARATEDGREQRAEPTLMTVLGKTAPATGFALMAWIRTRANVMPDGEGQTVRLLVVAQQAPTVRRVQTEGLLEV